MTTDPHLPDLPIPDRTPARGHASPTQPEIASAAESAFAEFRQGLRHELWSLVVDNQLPIASANAMLIRLGEPLLRRRWTVGVSIPVRCDVVAGSAREATDAAEAMIANVFDQAGPLPIDVLSENRSCTEPVRGDLDRNR